MAETYGSLGWTIEPLTPLAIEWSPSSGSTPRSRTHSDTLLVTADQLEDWLKSLCDAEFPILIVQPGAEP
jgi:hypothetical protein